MELLLVIGVLILVMLAYALGRYGGPGREPGTPDPSGELYDGGPPMSTGTSYDYRPDPGDYVDGRPWPRAVRIADSTIPIRGSDWESELDWERRQAAAQAREDRWARTRDRHTVWHSTGPKAEQGHWLEECPGDGCPVMALTSARAGILMIPDELGFERPKRSTAPFHYSDGCIGEHSPASNRECDMRPVDRRTPAEYRADVAP